MTDLSFHGARKQIIVMQLGFKINGNTYHWSANFNKARSACTYEEIGSLSDARSLFTLEDGRYRIGDSDFKPADFIYEGSILSSLKKDVLGEELSEIHNYLKNIRSMDLLSPHLIRQKSRASKVSDIGLGGEKLSAFLHKLTPAEKDDLVERLQTFNPLVQGIHTTKIRGGLVKIEVSEGVQNETSVATEARHLNDGLIRLLAINAQRYSDNTFILYDEIENGVNPEVTQSLLKALLESPKQTLVTTHSPVVLNYLPEDLARKSVTLIYKRADGITRAIKLFDIPMIEKKLEFLAPGEAVIDLPHSALAEEAEAILQELETKE